MKFELYEAPEATLVKLDTVDVITTSAPIFSDGDALDDGWIGI